MKTVKKLVIYIMLVTFVLSMTACGSKQGSEVIGTNDNKQDATSTVKNKQEENKPVELNFAMIAFANEIPGWTAMIDAANKKLADKGIKINIQKIPAQNWPEYYQKVITQIAAGTGPDIGRIAESFMPQIINRGQAVDLTDYLKELNMADYFEATFKNSGFKDGKYYGVPSGVYYMLLYYNKDMLNKENLKYPSADWNNSITFDQVREYAKKLTKGEGANKIFGFSAGPYMAYIGMYSVSNGGKNVFNEDGICALGSPESRQVYKWFDDMLRVDKSMPRPTDTKVMGAIDMFKAGRLAMIVEGTWMHSSIKNDIKNFRVGIAAVPSGNGKAYSSMFVDNFLIFKGTKYERESWEAIKAIISKEGFDALAPTGVGGLPVVRATLESLKNEMIGTQFTEEDEKAFINGLDHTIAVPYNEKYQEIDQNVNAVMDEWLLGKVSSDEFVDRVVEIVNKGMQSN
ncbi:MAG: ABC transporter substrate-binding protein [Bacillota bacterium]